MKTIVLFFAACLACVHAAQAPTKIADKEYLVKQKKIYELFWHVNQPTLYHSELHQKARSFSLKDNISSFTDQSAVLDFLQRWRNGEMLPRGELFSMMYQQHADEAICLFRIFYTAKDFDTFYNTAVWARFNVNEQMYIYVLSVSVIHRQDTKHIRLPPLYEVMPHYFFNDDVMQKAYQIGMGDMSVTGVMKTHTDVDSYYIPTNYSGWNMIRHNVPEQQRLSYFTEDVGLNAYYFMASHEFPNWMNTEKHMPANIRGEVYMYHHKQLLTRYYMERLSNRMGKIDHVDMEKPMVTGYYPMMRHHNGMPFPQRAVGTEVPLHVYEDVQALHDFKTRVSNAIDSGYAMDTNGKQFNIYDKDGFNQVGNMIEGNMDSINRKYYGNMDNMYRKVLGFGTEPVTKYKFVPSSLEIFCTSMRDPVFYGMYKNIINYWTKYKQHMPSYKQEELLFPGVKIDSVVVDKLVTFFDHFDSMLSNGMSVRNHQEAQSMLVKARQYRLNHKPFTYHITVNSQENIKGVIRIFLGPKYDVNGHEMDMSENYMNFMEVDQWVVDLKSGVNKIERNSHESIYVVPDEIPSEVLYKQIVKALDGGESFTYPTQLYGFPDRLMLPKGKAEGMPLKLFVCVTKFDETKTAEMESPIWGWSMTDGHAMGFPLDRPVRSYYSLMPNFYMKDVMIYHKQAEELNLTGKYGRSVTEE